MMVVSAASWTACAGLVLSHDAQNIAFLAKSDTGRTGIRITRAEA